MNNEHFERRISSPVARYNIVMGVNCLELWVLRLIYARSPYTNMDGKVKDKKFPINSYSILQIRQRSYHLLFPLFLDILK